MKEEIIRLEKITQIINGVTLLDNLNLHIFKGEVFGLLCINDHGKEALIQLICQNPSITFGSVYFLDSLANSYKYNTKTVNQVLVIEKPIPLIENFSVADNIFIMNRHIKKQLKEQLNSYFDYFNINISPSTLVSELSFYEKCVVLLLKAYIMDVKLIILRDLSNYISTVELKEIHLLLRKLVSEKMTCIYICNHHAEAFKICHRVAIMENGRVIKILDEKNFNDEIIKFYTMNFYHNAENNEKEKSEIVLKFIDVSTKNIKKMSFNIYKGECVTILDINNMALTDITNLLNSSQHPSNGEIEFGGIASSNDRNLLKSNIAIIYENPTQGMLFSGMNYIDNLCFFIDKKLKTVCLGKKIKKSIISEYKDFVGNDLFATDIYSLNIISLYNLVYYRVHLLNPKIAVCVQPFSGVDMYIRHHIIYLINKLLEKGITVLILTVNLSDTLYVADRLFVLEKGMLKKVYSNKDFYKFKSDINAVEHKDI